jgi:hypothetical protein
MCWVVLPIRIVRPYPLWIVEQMFENVRFALFVPRSWTFLGHFLDKSWINRPLKWLEMSVPCATVGT